MRMPSKDISIAIAQGFGGEALWMKLGEERAGTVGMRGREVAKRFLTAAALAGIRVIKRLHTLHDALAFNFDGGNGRRGGGEGEDGCPVACTLLFPVNAQVLPAEFTVMGLGRTPETSTVRLAARNTGASRSRAKSEKRRIGFSKESRLPNEHKDFYHAVPGRSSGFLVTVPNGLRCEPEAFTDLDRRPRFMV